MPSGFGELTVQAHHLVSAGDYAGAQRLLADALTDVDPRPDNASPELAEAAGLQARVLVALGDPHTARAWAAFAYAAARRLHGRSDERTVSAAATLAAVLHRVGSDVRAARLYSEVIIELTALDGPESQRVLAAHADLATVEFARGQCAMARDRLLDAWELHREVYGDGHPSGIKMLAKLGAMERDCGRYAESREHLALAEELCRLHLPADDPLAAQVASLAEASAKQDHACAEPSFRAGAAAKPDHARAEADPPCIDPTAQGRETPVVPAARVPPAAEGPPEQPLYHPPDRSAEHPPRTVPTPRLPPEAVGDAFDDLDDGWWPPEEEHLHEPYRPGESPPPAATVDDGEAPGVRRVQPAPEPEPEPPSRLLPVTAPPPPVADRRGTRWLAPALVGAVVLLIGAAAVTVGLSGGDDPQDSAHPPAAGSASAEPTGGTPSAAPPAAPGTPPGAVTLTDRRDNIALRWTYPSGAEGPVVIAGGRVGQNPRAFEELPAGTDSYIVYGLDRTTNYCFTVAVVWSADTVGRSQQVCTRRG